MREPIKNRFQIEPDAEAGSLRIQSDSPRVGRDAYPRDEGDTVYLDEPDPRHRQTRFRRFLIGGVAALILLALAVGGYFYLRDRDKNSELDLAEHRFQRVGDERLGDRFYIPEEKVSPPLARAISLYQANERGAAKRAFENFVNSDATEKEKSIALVFLGVMDLETERFGMAKYNLLRALKFDPESVAALVNLAIVERRQGNPTEAAEYAKRAQELAPRDPRVALLLGNVLAENQNLDGAIDAYKEGLSEGPNEPLLYYNMAVSLTRQERYEEALLNFARAARAAGTGTIAVQSYAQMGQIYFKQRNLEMAADHLAKAVSLAPDNGRYLYNLGIVYLYKNENDRALLYFQRALDAGANDVQVFRGLARAFEKLKSPSLAIRALEKGLYLKPDDVDTMFQLGDLYYAEQDLIRAAEVFRNLVNITPGDANTEDALLKLAAIYTEMERPNDAIDVLERAAHLNPKNTRVFYLLGTVYDRAGRRDLAVDNWKKALSPANAGGEPVPVSRTEERRIRLAMADVYRREGAYDLALREYRAVQERNRENPPMDSDPELARELGRTYMMLKDYGSAIQSYRAVTQSSGAGEKDLKDAYMNLALAHANRHEIDDARASANKAVRLDPVDQDAKLLQASILMRTDSMVDREKAIEILKAVTRSDVDAKLASKAYNLMGLCYMKNGEHRRALTAFDQSVQLDPANTEAYQNQRAAANAYEKDL